MKSVKRMSLVIFAVAFSLVALSAEDEASRRADESIKDLFAILKTLKETNLDGFLAYKYENYALMVEAIKQQYPQVMWREKIDERRRNELDELNETIYSLLDPKSRNYYLRPGDSSGSLGTDQDHLNISRLSWGAVFLLPGAEAGLLEVRSETYVVRVYGEINFTDPSSAPWGHPLYSYTPGSVRIRDGIRVKRILFTFALPKVPALPGVDTSEDGRRQYDDIIRQLAMDMEESISSGKVLGVVPSSMKFYDSAEQ